MPEACGDRITLEARLNYRKVGWWNTQWAYAGVRDPSHTDYSVGPGHDDGRWVEIAGANTFRQYLNSGYQAYRPTWDDWLLHLSTIFTESRFKPYLEVRGADCPLPGLEMTFPALVKGILYDDQARREAWEIVGAWSSVARQALYVMISRKGLGARIHGSSARERIVELVRTSREGLKRQNERNAEGQDESIYLEPLEERLREGWSCPAREILDLWKGPWKGNVKRLVEHTRF